MLIVFQAFVSNISSAFDISDTPTLAQRYIIASPFSFRQRLDAIGQTDDISSFRYAAIFFAISSFRFSSRFHYYFFIS